MTTATRGRPRSFDRDAALDKAIRLFWRKGYASASMRDLVDELGIAAPSIYHAFGSKAELFTEAVAVYDQRYGGFIDAALAEEATATAAALRILTEAPDRYTRPTLPPGCLIVSGDAGCVDESIATTMAELRASKVTELAARITSDIALGLLSPDVDATALAQYTMTVLTGIAEGARDGIDRERLRQVAAVARLPWETAS